MRRRRRGKLADFKVLVAVALILALVVYGVYAGTRLFVRPPGEDPAPGMSDGMPAKRMNFVLLGLDTSEGETIARADSVLFVSADPGEERLVLLSIPRDTRVNIPRRGWDKINATTVYGGPELARAVVSDLLGLPVDYYIMTDFDGFREIVDILGGVTINVERRMYYRDPIARPPLVIDLQPGEQRLDGNKALQYVRFRGDGLGDITRTQRQQKFLKALASEMLKPRNIVKLPKLVPKLNQCVETNMDLREMIRWANLVRKYDQVEMISATLPGNFLDRDGLSYWHVDPQRAREAAVRLLAGEEIGSPVDERTTIPAGVAQRPGPAPVRQPSEETEPVREGPPAEAPEASEVPFVDPDEPLDDPVAPPLPGLETGGDGEEDRKGASDSGGGPDNGWSVPPPPPPLGSAMRL